MNDCFDNNQGTDWWGWPGIDYCAFPAGAAVRSCDGESCVSLDAWGDGTCDDAFDCEARKHDNQDCKTYCQGSTWGGYSDGWGIDAGICASQCAVEGGDPFSDCWIDKGKSCGMVDEHKGACQGDAVLGCYGPSQCPTGSTCGYEDIGDHSDARCFGICGNGHCSGWDEWQGGDWWYSYEPCHQDCNPCADPSDPTYIDDSEWGPDCNGGCDDLFYKKGDGWCDESLNCAEHDYDGSDCCVPDCAGYQCGDDGCGTSCGDCPNGGGCTESGACACTPGCVGEWTLGGDCSLGVNCATFSATCEIDPDDGEPKCQPL